jgi:8-oxo-dGTP pyrophosphatase MutT (NUDIX family)
MISKFNVRLYGIWVKHGRILLSFEETKDFSFWKFPGGGLEFGEGTVEGLRREFREELGIEIATYDLYHVNEDFIPSAFNSEDQLISIYYSVNSEDEPGRMGFEEMRWGKPYKVQFSWIVMEELNSEIFSLPVDRTVAKMLMDSFPGFIS